MSGRTALSQPEARRIALAAQGFHDRSPSGAVDSRLLERVVARTHLFQIDSVNVFERAHYMPLYSRLGPYAKQVLDRAAYRDRKLFEYWGHEASLLPVELHPLLRWRMERAARGEEGWGGTKRIAKEHPDFVEKVLAEVRVRGPVSAGELAGQRTSNGTWWGWTSASPPSSHGEEVGYDGGATKVALEHLFWTGQVTTAGRRSFERLYDVTERVLPADLLARPTPTREDAQRELVRLAARAHGVATERDLRDYFRLRVDEARAAVQSLVSGGELLPVRVDGWTSPAYLWPGAALPRRVRASALLSPFDPLVWERARTSRLFGFDYRIEIYVPAPKRVHGYYVLPFLHDEALRARVDLKSDRRAGVLRVLAAWLEPGHDAGETATALAAELRRAAAWQGLGEVVVEPRGDLAGALAPALSSAEQGSAG